MSASLTPFGYGHHCEMRTEWQVAHMESSAPTLIPSTGTCLCSPTFAQIFTPCTHIGVVTKRWCSYPCPAPGLMLPIPGWQSSVAVAPGALDTTQRADPFFQEQLRAPQTSLLLPTFTFILFPPTPRGWGTEGCPAAGPAPPEWSPAVQSQFPHANKVVLTIIS